MRMISGARYPGKSISMSMSFDQTLKRSYRYNKENFPRILELADGLKKVGEAHKATAGQVALAWLLGQGEDVIPIPGTTKINVRYGSFQLAMC